ncbi:MAG TPA: flagellar hook assembly protein FlgD [Caulobacter sp.]|nr:flagellar hook assembly protein FlgD [Caulobacter sp.]
MTDAVSNSSAASLLDKQASSRNRLADSEETFLALLTTQLKNQDPLSPLDSNEFTAQIVQMTGVEQQLLTNDLLTMLVGMNDGGLAGSVDLIGKTVTAATDEATLQDGKSTWTYDLDRNATSVKYEVVNSAGQTVYSETKDSVAAGDQAFEWNGKTTQGTQLSDGGTYSLKITATGSGGETINTSIFTSGVASGVETLNGETVVTVGKLKIPVSSITSVQQTV